MTDCFSDYDGQDDSRKCHALAIEAMRGHAYIDVQDGKAEIVVHRYAAEGAEEFRAPMTRNVILTLMQHCLNALQRIGP
jgi:hypothetical protein